MREHLVGLYQIQKIDVAIHELREKKSSIPNELDSLEFELNSVKDEIAKLSGEVDEHSREATSLQTIVQSETVKLKKWEARLKEIRNQREFQALSREIEGSKRANRDTEEKIIELWKLKEETSGKLEAKTSRLAELESAFSERKEEVGTSLAEIESQLSREEARRDELQPGIPDRLWTVSYTHLTLPTICSV